MKHLTQIIGIGPI